MRGRPFTHASLLCLDHACGGLHSCSEPVISVVISFLEDGISQCFHVLSGSYILSTLSSTSLLSFRGYDMIFLIGVEHYFQHFMQPWSILKDNWFMLMDIWSILMDESFPLVDILFIVLQLSFLLVILVYCLIAYCSILSSFVLWYLLYDLNVSFPLYT